VTFPGTSGDRPIVRSTLVFDLDGTLIDSAPDLAGALNTLLDEEGLAPLPVESVRNMVGEGAVRMIERGLEAHGRTLTPEMTEDYRQRFIALYEQRMTDETVIFPGVMEALGVLAEGGRPMAVCTNKPEGLSLAILADLGMARYFSAVIGGDSLAERKPHPLPLTTAVKRAGGDPGNAVMIGDSMTDVAAARAAGTPVVVVSYGYTRIPPRELGADLVIDAFAHLHDALDTLGHG
jgi:phosphoglycolate phosphatase